MLTFVLRRLLWSVPALIVVSWVLFFLLSWMPPQPGVASNAAARREQFLDLPRFVNLSPVDVKQRASRAVDAIAEESAEAPAAGRELVRLGGAALPYVLPRLDALAPDPRRRVALALSPLAERMGLFGADRASDPDQAVAFWSRFWEERNIEFRQTNVRTAVERLARYRSSSRAEDLRALDTFALDALFDALPMPSDETDLQTARVITGRIAELLPGTPRIAEGDSLRRGREVVETLGRHWFVYRHDYVELVGLERWAATFTDTRYGRWALSSLSERGLGRTFDGQPVTHVIAQHAPVTLLLVFGGIAAAYATALLLGAAAAASRGRKTDLAIAVFVLAVYAVPTAVFAIWLDAGTGGIAVATLVVALSLVAAPTRQQRAALAGALGQDFARAAAARGASRLRVVFVHASRVALIPIVTLVVLEVPIALGAAFVVEHVFALRGLGDVTLEAVARRDLSMLMALSLLTAASAALGLMVSDIAVAQLDPRTRDAILRGKARSL